VVEDLGGWESELGPQILKTFESTESTESTILSTFLLSPSQKDTTTLLLYYFYHPYHSSYSRERDYLYTSFRFVSSCNRIHYITLIPFISKCTANCALKKKHQTSLTPLPPYGISSIPRSGHSALGVLRSPSNCLSLSFEGIRSFYWRQSPVNSSYLASHSPSYTMAHINGSDAKPHRNGTVPKLNGSPSYAAKHNLADHFIGGNRLEIAPAGPVKDFVANHDGHTVITNVSKIIRRYVLSPNAFKVQLTVFLLRSSSPTMELLQSKRSAQCGNGHTKPSAMNELFSSPSWPPQKIYKQMQIISAWQINM